MCIDFHTHAFPDEVAAKAIPVLEKQGQVEACLDGRVSSLLSSMDHSGIHKSVICSIATRPAQFAPILEWSKKIASKKLIPLCSLHPDDPEAVSHLKQIRKHGFIGIKLHPYYQEFAIDEDKLMPIYETLADEGLIVVMHSGYDVGFPRIRIAEPIRIQNVLKRFPNLKMVATHFGGWEMWDEVEELLIGRPIYMDISYSLPFLDTERARRMVLAHPKEYILFGSDSPWEKQQDVLDQLEKLNLPGEIHTAILAGNAEKLLSQNE